MVCPCSGEVTGAEASATRLFNPKAFLRLIHPYLSGQQGPPVALPFGAAPFFTLEPNTDLFLCSLLLFSGKS